MKKEKGRADRYDLEGASDLGVRGGPTNHSIRVGNIAPATVAVADPQPDSRGGPDQRVIATVNRRVDILEYERAHGRIGNDAYLEGRIVQALFERIGLPGSAWNAGSRVDAVVAKEIAVIRKIDTARAIEAQLHMLRVMLGETDMLIVRQVLGQNRTYAEVAQTGNLKDAAARAGAHDWIDYGKGGKRAPAKAEVRTRRITYIAQRFRDALETLARESRRR
jgi:hypothetical protein